MDFFNRDHAACLLSGIKKRPLVGGFLYTSTILISICDIASGLYIEVYCLLVGVSVMGGSTVRTCTMNITYTSSCSGFFFWRRSKN